MNERLFLYKYNIAQKQILKEIIYVEYLEASKCYLSKLFEINILNKRIFDEADLNEIGKGKDFFGEYFFLYSNKEIDFKNTLKSYFKEQEIALKEAILYEVCREN